MKQKNLIQLGMSSTFCELTEAFESLPKVQTLQTLQAQQKQTPAPLPGKPVQTDTPSPMTGALPSLSGKPDSSEGAGSLDFFPLPGETASTEDWTKAFLLGPSSIPGLTNVSGGSTLWRQQQQQQPLITTSNDTTSPPVSLSSLPSSTLDFQQRFEQLAQQLNSLTKTTPMQNTAELFLFIAIGLLVLLALDSLLRFATLLATATAKKGYKMRGGASSLRRMIRYR